MRFQVLGFWVLCWGLGGGVFGSELWSLGFEVSGFGVSVFGGYGATVDGPVVLHEPVKVPGRWVQGSVIAVYCFGFRVYSLGFRVSG